MTDMTVHSTVRNKTQQVQRTAVGFYGLHSFTQNSVFKKVTVFYCFSDPCQLLIYNTSCPDIQVTDFGITHLPVWQAYGCTRTG